MKIIEVPDPPGTKLILIAKNAGESKTLSWFARPENPLTARVEYVFGHQFTRLIIRKEKP